MPAKSAGHADAIRAAVLLVQYVTHCAVYVNDGDAADDRGIPAHNVAVVVRLGKGLRRRRDLRNGQRNVCGRGAGHPIL